MPKIIDKEAKKHDIATAAIKVIARRGLATTKMTEIAEAAGIGKGTIYEYFKNKDEIFVFAFEEFKQLLDNSIGPKIFKITDPVEKLRALFDGWADILSGEHQEIMTLMVDFWGQAIRENATNAMKLIHMDEMYADYRKMLKSILDEGIRTRQFRKVDTHLTASILLGALDGIMLQWILDNDVFDIRDAIECLTEGFLIGICIE